MSSHRVLHDHLLEFEACNDPNLNNHYENLDYAIFPRKILAKIGSLVPQIWNRLIVLLSMIKCEIRC